MSGAVDPHHARRRWPSARKALRQGHRVPRCADLARKKLRVRMINVDADPLLVASTELAGDFEGTGKATRA